MELIDEKFLSSFVMLRFVAEMQRAVGCFYKKNFCIIESIQ